MSNWKKSMDTEKDNGGVINHGEIYVNIDSMFFEDTLSFDAKFVFPCASYLMDKSGRADKKKIAAYCGISLDRVEVAMKELREAGWVGTKVDWENAYSANGWLENPDINEENE